MRAILIVGLGGALGSALRYAATLGAMRAFGSSFPLGTLFVNVTGSLLMGLLAELIARHFGASAELRLLLMTGVLGGYTTFSAFSLDAVALYERGAPVAAAAYVLASVLLSIGAVVVGIALARQIA